MTTDVRPRAATRRVMSASGARVAAVRRFSITLLATTAFSCSSPNGSSSADAVRDAAVEASRGAEAPCSEPSEDPAAQCVETVTGKAIDTTGAPVVGKVVSICGTICYYAQTGADGTYLAKVGSII